MGVCTRAAICAEGDRDRQAEQLPRRAAPSASRRRTPTKPVSEQPRRELASVDTAARAADATVQIIRASPGLSLRPLVHLSPLPAAPTPACSQCLSCNPVRRLQDLAAGDLCPTHSLIAAARPSLAPRCPHEVNVTMPTTIPSSRRSNSSMPASLSLRSCYQTSQT